MQTNEIKERIKISDKAIRINELLSIRTEIKKQVEEAYQKMRALNTELTELLPVRVDIPSCEKCGKDLVFADVMVAEDTIQTKMLCKECEPHE